MLQEETLRDYDTGHLYGLEKFWAFLHYSKQKPEMEPRIAQLLKKYRRIEDFRINVSKDIVNTSFVLSP